MQLGLSSAFGMVGGNEQLDFHTHVEYEIYFFHEGECHFQIGSRFYEMVAGDILLIDGMKMHKAFVNQKNVAYKRSIIHFKRDWIEPVLAALEAKEILGLFNDTYEHLYRVNDPAERKQIFNMFRTINELSRTAKSTIDVAKLKLSLVQLLIEIDSSNHENVINIHADRGSKLSKVEEIAQFVSQNYQDKLTLDEIAQGVNLSKSYCAHLFKDMTGMTVINFLMAYRLTQARFQLVINPSLTVTEIAKLSGFESIAHFSRFFKKHVGQTPLEFRRHSETEATGNLYFDPLNR